MRGNIKYFKESGEWVSFSQQINLESHTSILLQAYCRKNIHISPGREQQSGTQWCPCHPQFLSSCRFGARLSKARRTSALKGLGGKGRPSTCTGVRARTLGGVREELMLQKAGQRTMCCGFASTIEQLLTGIYPEERILNIPNQKRCLQLQVC